MPVPEQEVPSESSLPRKQTDWKQIPVAWQSPEIHAAPLKALMQDGTGGAVVVDVVEVVEVVVVDVEVVVVVLVEVDVVVDVDVLVDVDVNVEVEVVLVDVLVLVVVGARE